MLFLIPKDNLLSISPSFNSIKMKKKNDSKLELRTIFKKKINYSRGCTKKTVFLFSGYCKYVKELEKIIE
jgi:hypothetical protein